MEKKVERELNCGVLPFLLFFFLGGGGQVFGTPARGGGGGEEVERLLDADSGQRFKPPE